MKVGWTKFIEETERTLAFLVVKLCPVQDSLLPVEISVSPLSFDKWEATVEAC